MADEVRLVTNAGQLAADEVEHLNDQLDTCAGDLLRMELLSGQMPAKKTRRPKAKQIVTPDKP